MEMNTRLQVEHPVSEAITGIDIVKEQIRIAANERLELEQSRIAAKGHAIECRINAEDPSQGFRPSPGKITVLEIPRDKGPGTLRVDTHLAAGDEVSPYYDSLVAKVIAHAPSRAGAIETMLRALASSRIEGIATTIPLHLEVLVSEEFRSGRYDTSRIPGWKGAPTSARA
jgi:acetyl-CoA carboxylase biotin carboxylase subunit